MAGIYGLDRDFYAYHSDDGNIYQVALTNDDAAAGGFGSSIAPGSHSSFPRGWRMRGMYGVAAGPIRTKIPYANLGSGWTTPIGFTKGPSSTAFAVEGVFGEKRFTRS